MFEKTNSDVARREFQKTLDLDQSRRARFDNRLKLRKTSREAHLQKRRRALQNPCSDSLSGSSQVKTADIQHLQTYIQQIHHANEEERYSGVQSIRILLSVERDPPTTAVLNSGVVPDIINMMRAPSSSDKLRFEAAWVCTNIAAGSKETACLVEMNVVPAFVALFRSAKNVEVAEQAIWGLGNIAGENAPIRNLVLQTGVLTDLVSRIERYTGTTKKNAIWTISNLCRHKPYPRWKDVKFCVPVLAKLLIQTIKTNNESGILTDVLWTFTYISDDPHPELNEQVQAIINAGVVQALVQILRTEHVNYEQVCKEHPNVDRKTALKTLNFQICQPALRTIGNIVTGTDEHTKIVLDAGFLDLIQPFLQHFSNNIRKETLWTISNVCAGCAEQIECVISREWLFKAVIDMCENDVVVVRREAGWVLCNAANGSLPDQKKRMVDRGIIKALTSLLQLQDQESVLRMTIEGLNALFEVYLDASHNPWADMFEDQHGLDFLEDIQANTSLSEACYQMSVNMIERFFGVANYDNDYNKAQQFLSDTIQPNVDSSNQFTFGISNATAGSGNTDTTNTATSNNFNHGNQFQAGNDTNSAFAQTNGVGNDNNNNRFDF